MAAIDDALFQYIGNDHGTSVYWDSGPSMAHGLLVGSSPHSPPLWVNDGGKNVIHFDAVAAYSGFAENAPRIQVIHDWGNFGGDDFSHCHVDPCEDRPRRNPYSSVQRICRWIVTTGVLDFTLWPSIQIQSARCVGVRYVIRLRPNPTR